jgi:phage recombination protein Bet
MAENTLITYAPEGVSDKENYINLIKKDLIKGKGSVAPTENELVYFLQVCQSSGLNPLTRQIYAIFRGGQMTIQTGIDGLRAIAERTGAYGGSDDAVFTYDGDKLQKASITVRKVVKGVVLETTASAKWEEYFVPSSPMWKKMPETMLAKCAEAKALRKAFPNIGQIYVDEEMNQATPQVSEETVIAADTEKVAQEVESLVREALEEKEDVKNTD